uniref:G-protein coupled receptors family 3 profile domain-containing protein n=1 Tax=Plectus sambesii TaxID=2011161 RepID=A0A914WBF6_9BILA
MRSGRSRRWLHSLAAALLLWGVGTAAAIVDELDNRSAVYPGDLLLGGMFPLRGRGEFGNCSEFNVHGLFALEALHFSLDKVNARLKSQCGFSLGSVSLDTCASPTVGLYQALQFVMPSLIGRSPSNQAGSMSGHDVIGVVGPMHSDTTEQVANMLGMFKIPQISFMATSPTLSNPTRYPYFLRTTPSDDNQGDSLVQILLHMKWSYVIAAYEDTVYGLRGLQAFEKSLQQVNKGAEICIGHRWKIDMDSPEAVDLEYYRKQLRQLSEEKSRARVMLLFMSDSIAHHIFAAVREERLEKHYVWVGTDGWGSRYVEPEIREAVDGAVVSVPIVRKLNGFDDYLLTRTVENNERNPWFALVTNRSLACAETPDGRSHNRRGERTCEHMDNETMQEHVRHCEFTGFMHFVYEAVQAYATALEEMHRKLCDKRMGVCPALYNELQKPGRRMLYEHLREIHFQDAENKSVHFHNGRDGLPKYSVLTYKQNARGDYVWQPIATLYFNESSPDLLEEADLTSVEWLKNYPISECGSKCPGWSIRRYQKDKCCWDCENCTFPSVKLNETHCGVCLMDMDRQIFTKPNEWRNACETFDATIVGFTNPIVATVVTAAGAGIIATIVTLVLFITYSSTPIIKASGRELSLVLLVGIALCYSTVFMVAVKPTKYTCVLVRFLYSLSYTVCYAAIFVKTNRIVRIFHMTDKGPKQRKTRYISPVSQLLVTALIIGFQIMLCVVWQVLKPAAADFDAVFDDENESVTVYRFCEALEDSDWLIALSLPSLLLLLSGLYAFKARKCPGKFNETKYIIISTYTACIVFVAFIPLFFTVAKMPFRIVVLCVALCINATVTLLCMFAPKLYVVLIRPHKNTRDNVMGRKHTASSNVHLTDNNCIQPSTTDSYSKDVGAPAGGRSSTFSAGSLKASDSSGRSSREYGRTSVDGLGRTSTDLRAMNNRRRWTDAGGRTDLVEQLVVQEIATQTSGDYDQPADSDDEDSY